MPRPLSFRHAHSGFTLMELLLVLALLAVLGATAWPLATNAFASVKLRNAAQQVQACWDKARVQAISNGLPHVFRFGSDAADYSVAPWYDENAAIETTTPIAANTFTPSTTPPQNPTHDGTATTNRPKLPDGMTFVGIERSGETRSFAADEQLSIAGIAATALPVVFYPDGTSSDAALTITDGKGRYITVNLRGLTGITRIGEITAGPEVAK
ncbi:MAG: prepilin-type N-terminal cleavage/methylation domain-containing protein [Pirellulales bacterium]|nr:prepilin-type N-terminal cleavage/methylation domain-containing protein [Pirellulales bacterium]